MIQTPTPTPQHGKSGGFCAHSIFSSLSRSFHAGRLRETLDVTRWKRLAWRSSCQTLHINWPRLQAGKTTSRLRAQLQGSRLKRLEEKPLLTNQPMGHWLSKLLENFVEGPPARVLMLGLDAAGKTTILYKVKLNETVSTIPTIGFNVEEVRPCKGVSFTVWDVGGQEKIRALWRHYYQNSEGLLFIVDSADRHRFAEARTEMMGVLDADEMRRVPVVVVANKQDLPGAATVAEVADAMGLHKMTQRSWRIQGATATNGDGIYEAMQGLSELVKEFRRRK